MNLFAVAYGSEVAVYFDAAYVDIAEEANNVCLTVTNAGHNLTC